MLPAKDPEDEDEFPSPSFTVEVVSSTRIDVSIGTSTGLGVVVVVPRFVVGFTVSVVVARDFLVVVVASVLAVLWRIGGDLVVGASSLLLLPFGEGLFVVLLVDFVAVAGSLPGAMDLSS